MRESPHRSDWRLRPRAEIRALISSVSGLDTQTIVVLLYAAVAVILQMHFGDRNLFRNEIAPALGIEDASLAAWSWWFVVQGLLGFVAPILILRFGFRQSLEQMGLGAGDWQFAVMLALVYLPIVIVGTWILSDRPDFQSSYPHYAPAARDWGVFFVYQAVFLFYWMGWEYLWRGFVLFGTARTFGIYAVVVQAVPFAILHYGKPFPEAILSVFGGVALGVLVWRTRSFWIAVPIHAAQMWFIDFFCSLRIRTGVSGLGPASLMEMLKKF